MATPDLPFELRLPPLGALIDLLTRPELIGAAEHAAWRAAMARDLAELAADRPATLATLARANRLFAKLRAHWNSCRPSPAC